MAGRTVETLVRTLRRAIGLSLADWRYLAIAVKELGLARVRHATQPIGHILRELQTERPLPAEAGDSVDLARLSWALGAAAARVPWRSDCLLRAMAADRWLRRHGHQPEFFLGVNTDATTGFGAHAWLRCSGIIITGGESTEYTQLLAPPASPPRLPP